MPENPWRSLSRDWHVMLNLENNQQSSFKAATWASFFETAFNVGRLNSRSLFRLIESVMDFVCSIILSDTNALYWTWAIFLMFFMDSTTSVGMVSFVSREIKTQLSSLKGFSKDENF